MYKRCFEAFIRKKPTNGHLSPSDVAFNDNVSSDGITVDNIFRHLYELKMILLSKWRCSEFIFDFFFSFDCYLYKCSCSMAALDHSDVVMFCQNRKRLIRIAQDVLDKCCHVLQSYKDHRQARLYRQCRQSQFSDCVLALWGSLQQPNLLGIFLRNLIYTLCVSINHVFFYLSLGNTSDSYNFSLAFVNYNLIVFTCSLTVISKFSRSILYCSVILQMCDRLTADLLQDLKLVTN